MLPVLYLVYGCPFPVFNINWIIKNFFFLREKRKETNIKKAMLRYATHSKVYNEGVIAHTLHLTKKNSEEKKTTNLWNRKNACDCLP